MTVELSRASVVVSIDDERARRKVEPWIGRYVSADDVHHASITYRDGHFRLVQDVNRGQAWVTLDVPTDLLAEPLDAKEFDARLGRHTVHRSCRFDRATLVFTEIRTGWFKRLVRFVSLHLSTDGLEVNRDTVIERRGWRGLLDWYEDPRDAEAWALREREHLVYFRVPAGISSEDEFVRGSGPQPRRDCSRVPEDAPKRSGQVLAFPVRPSCGRNLDGEP